MVMNNKNGTVKMKLTLGPESNSIRTHDKKD